MKAEKDYEDLLKLLNAHKVKYCIVGAYAIAFHSIPRYTKDIDILLKPDEENAKKIISVLETFGFSNLGLTEKDFSEKGNIIQLGYEPLRIDLLTSLDGCTFDEVWKGKVKGKYGETTVHYIGVNELIKNKQATNRYQDKADIEMLRNSQNNGAGS